MNYIRHLHAFYQCIKNDERLSSMHVSLYLALFQYWNYHRFQNPFNISRADLMLLSKIKSKNSYHKCMKDLHQKKFIIYYSSNSKFIQAKASMVKLGLKMPDQKLHQLDLFNPPIDNPSGIINDTVTVSKSVPPRYQNQYCQGINNDTGEATFQNPPVSKTIPLRYQNQYRHGIKNDTDTVSKMILLIKHKHKTVNSSICYKKTVSEIFEKNKKIQQQILSLKNELLEKEFGAGPAPKFQETGAEKNQPIPEIKTCDAGYGKNHPDMNQVETFFRDKNFPAEEAPKFFYYNQSRNWMLNPTTPIKDWQAMAHKWMLVQKEKNIPNQKQSDHGKNESKQSANAAFLRDAKNDFDASSGRSHGDLPQIPGVAIPENE
jgi:hypothetical protein